MSEEMRKAVEFADKLTTECSKTLAKSEFAVNNAEAVVAMYGVDSSMAKEMLRVARKAVDDCNSCISDALAKLSGKRTPTEEFLSYLLSEGRC